MTAALRAQIEEAEGNLDRRWGYGQAINIVDDALAAKVNRQISKWYAALASNDNAQIEVHGNAMLKAFAALDAAAVARYGEPADHTDERDDVMVCRLKNGDVIYVVRDGEEADRITKQGSIAFTLDELALCAEGAPGWPVIMETKRVFAGATVARAEKAMGEDFWKRGDEIPL